MAKNEVALSTKKLKEEGIEVKVTQNDIIELLVQEQVDLVLNAGRAIIAEQQAWLTTVKTEWDEAVEKELAKLSIPKGFKVSSITKNFSGSALSTNFLQEASHERTGFSVFRRRYDSFYFECDAKCSVRVTKTIHGIDMHGDIPFKFYFIHNEKVKKTNIQKLQENTLLKVLNGKLIKCIVRKKLLNY